NGGQLVAHEAFQVVLATRIHDVVCFERSQSSIQCPLHYLEIERIKGSFQMSIGFHWSLLIPSVGKRELFTHWRRCLSKRSNLLLKKFGLNQSVGLPTSR